MTHPTLQNILILGAGRFAEEVAEAIGAMPGVRVAGYMQNLDPQKTGDTLGGLPVLTPSEAKPLASTHLAIAAIGSPARRGIIDEARGLGFQFAKAIHPSAIVSPSAQIGAGVYIAAGVIVAAQSILGEHCIVNRGALIGHHTRIGALCTIGPGANIAGSVSIGEAVQIGMGALVLDTRSVGARSVVGSGAVVTKDIPEDVQALGMPAKVTKSLL